MHRSAFGLVLAALVLAGCDSNSPDSVMAPTDVPSFSKKDDVPDKEHVTTKFTRIVSNPCPPVPEMVLVTGTERMHSHFKHFEEGNTARHHVMAQAHGVGLVTGVRYTFHELTRQESDFRFESGVFQGEQRIRHQVVSATSLGNFFLTTHRRFRCDATGCTSEIVSMEPDCRG